MEISEFAPYRRRFLEMFGVDVLQADDDFITSENHGYEIKIRRHAEDIVVRKDSVIFIKMDYSMMPVTSFERILSIIRSTML